MSVHSAVHLAQDEEDQDEGTHDPIQSDFNIRTSTQTDKSFNSAV